MKKIYTLLLIIMSLFIIGTKAMAVDATSYVPHKIAVILQDDISSQNPPTEFSVALPEECILKGIKTIEKGTILYVKVLKINKETIGKQDANIVAKIFKAYVPSQDKTVDVTAINPNAIVKFSPYNPLDVTDSALNVGIIVANKYVKNIIAPARFVKGAVKNESGDRLKSGLTETYESSVFSYVKSGKPIELKKGSLVTLTYYTKDLKTSNSTDNSDKTKEEEKEEK